MAGAPSADKGEMIVAKNTATTAMDDALAAEILNMSRPQPSMSDKPAGPTPAIEPVATDGSAKVYLPTIHMGSSEAPTYQGTGSIAPAVGPAPVVRPAGTDEVTETRHPESVRTQQDGADFLFGVPDTDEPAVRGRTPDRTGADDATSGHGVAQPTIAPEPTQTAGAKTVPTSPESPSPDAAAGETATGNQTVTVSNDTAADRTAMSPLLTVNDVAGTEDTAIALDIASALADSDGSETLSITVSGMPAGASLSAGIDNGDGSWTLTAAQIAGLTLTPPADSDGDFTLTVTATSTEANGGDTASTVATFDVTVNADADAPTLTASADNGLAGTPIALDITAALTDLDGSETLGNVVISGMPADAVLSAGVDNGDGTWTLTAADLPGLTVTPGVGNETDLALTVTTTSTEANGGDTASTNTSVNVWVFAQVINGGAGSDELNGGAGDDQIFGHGDSDEIYGNGGNDELHGGSGDDDVFGGAGNDVLYGDGGKDRLYGGGGDDTLYGGADDDRFWGGDGNDTFHLGVGRDEAYGEAGDDMLVFAQGSGTDNTFDGGAGWTDVIQVNDVAGAPAPGDWTLQITSGSITGTDAGGYDLSADAAGIITLDDGSEVVFTGVERIQW